MPIFGVDIGIVLKRSVFCESRLSIGLHAAVTLAANRVGFQSGLQPLIQATNISRRANLPRVYEIGVFLKLKLFRSKYKLMGFYDIPILKSYLINFTVGRSIPNNMKNNLHCKYLCCFV